MKHKQKMSEIRARGQAARDRIQFLEFRRAAVMKWDNSVVEFREFHRSLGLLGITARMMPRFRDLLRSIITF